MAINITTNIVNTTGGNVTQITAVQGGWQTIKTAASMSALTGSAILKQNLADGQIFYISESQELYQLTIAGTVPFQTYTFNSFDWPGGGGGSTDTGSLLTTASISNNVFTFTKGDGNTFDIDISPVTASLITTASVSSNTITFTKGDGNTFNLTVDTGSGGGGDAFPYTGSAEVTGSFGVTGSVGVDIEDGNGGNTKFAVNSEGAIVLAALVTPPTAITGGVYYSASGDFFVGTN